MLDINNKHRKINWLSDPTKIKEEITPNLINETYRSSYHTQRKGESFNILTSSGVVDVHTYIRQRHSYFLRRKVNYFSLQNLMMKNWRHLNRNASSRMYFPRFFIGWTISALICWEKHIKLFAEHLCRFSVK